MNMLRSLSKSQVFADDYVTIGAQICPHPTPYQFGPIELASRTKLCLGGGGVVYFGFRFSLGLGLGLVLVLEVGLGLV